MASIVRHIMLYIISLSILVVAVLICLSTYGSAYDQQAKEEINAIVKKIEDYHRAKGVYPEDLAGVGAVKEKFKKIWFVFPAAKINYRVQDNGYKIEYYEFPFGPFHGYSSKNGDWYYEE